MSDMTQLKFQLLFCGLFCLQHGCDSTDPDSTTIFTVPEVCNEGMQPCPDSKECRANLKNCPTQPTEPVTFPEPTEMTTEADMTSTFVIDRTLYTSSVANEPDVTNKNKEKTTQIDQSTEDPHDLMTTQHTTDDALQHTTDSGYYVTSEGTTVQETVDFTSLTSSVPAETTEISSEPEFTEDDVTTDNVITSHLSSVAIETVTSSSSSSILTTPDEDTVSSSSSSSSVTVTAQNVSASSQSGQSSSSSSQETDGFGQPEPEHNVTMTTTAPISNSIILVFRGKLTEKEDFKMALQKDLTTKIDEFFSVKGVDEFNYGVVILYVRSIGKNNQTITSEASVLKYPINATSERKLVPPSDILSALKIKSSGIFSNKQEDELKFICAYPSKEEPCTDLQFIQGGDNSHGLDQYNRHLFIAIFVTCSLFLILILAVLISIRCKQRRRATYVTNVTLEKASLTHAEEHLCINSPLSDKEILKEEMETSLSKNGAPPILPEDGWIIPLDDIPEIINSTTEDTKL